jgi:hypothetical protein
VPAALTWLSSNAYNETRKVDDAVFVAIDYQAVFGDDVQITIGLSPNRGLCLRRESDDESVGIELPPEIWPAVFKLLDTFDFI